MHGSTDPDPGGRNACASNAQPKFTVASAPIGRADRMKGADFNPAGTSAPIGPSQSEFDPLGPSASPGSASRPELFLAPAHPAGRSGNGWA